MKIHQIYLALTFLTFVSCEKELDIELEGNDQLIVVNSIFTSGQIFEAEVTQSFSPYGDISVNELEGATVSLYGNDVFLENLTYSKLPTDSLGKFKSTSIAEKGVNYEIKVNDPNLGEASATGSSPGLVELITTEVIHDNSWDSISSIKCDYSFSFTDLVGEDYYYITMKIPVLKWDETAEEYVFYTFQNAAIETSDIPKHQVYLENGLLFNDESFNGSTFTISGDFTTSTYPWGDFEITDDLKVDRSHVYINVNHISKQLYDFYSSYTVKLESQNDLYSEPTSIYSNITDGIGVFAGQNTYTAIVPIEY